MRLVGDRTRRKKVLWPPAQSFFPRSRTLPGLSRAVRMPDAVKRAEARRIFVSDLGKAARQYSQLKRG